MAASVTASNGDLSIFVIADLPETFKDNLDEIERLEAENSQQTRRDQTQCVKPGFAFLLPRKCETTIWLRVLTT
jgi:uncharacterized small protein (DUF1192 family)